MSRASDNLLRLARVLGHHQGVSHWAISKRCTGGYGRAGKGDFFRLIEKGREPRSDTCERAMDWFSEHWPEDLEWPADIDRPARITQKPIKKRRGAA